MTGGEERRALRWLVLGAFLWFGLFAKGHVDNTDTLQSLYAARSLVLRGDLGIPRTPDDHGLPAERRMVTAPHRNGMEGSNGRFYVWFPLGHQLLLTVPAALGEGLASVFPEAPRRYRELVGPGWGDLFWSQWCASFLGAVCAAAGVLVLYRLARVLGRPPRGALLVAGVVGLATQHWPMTSENLSDVPGQVLLWAAFLQVARHATGGERTTLLWAGTWCGLAVLLRYPHALAVVVLGILVVHTSWHRRRFADPVWLALGGLPCLVVLLAGNHLRFGDPFETGYGSAGLDQWFGYPFVWGLVSILFAWGKGLLVLSPLLGLALLRGFQRSLRDRLGIGAWLLFALPVLLFANTDGWQAGGCWGIRYAAPGALLFLAVVLARTAPWRARPRCFAAACGVGALLAVIGLLAPVRGHQQLASAAAQVHYARQGTALSRGDVPLHVFTEWRWSPVHAHGTWAWLALTGRLEEGGSPNTTEPLFGVRVLPGETPLPDPVRPTVWTDRGFRHLWWVCAGSAFGAVWGWLVAPWLVLALLALRRMWRGLR